jgi:hypothetical protein
MTENFLRMRPTMLMLRPMRLLVILSFNVHKLYKNFSHDPPKKIGVVNHSKALLYDAGVNSVYEEVICCRTPRYRVTPSTLIYRINMMLHQSTAIMVNDVDLHSLLPLHNVKPSNP